MSDFSRLIRETVQSRKFRVVETEQAEEQESKPSQRTDFAPGARPSVPLDTEVDDSMNALIRRSARPGWS